jgi:hypothetical protein
MKKLHLVVQAPAPGEHQRSLGVGPQLQYFMEEINPNSIEGSFQKYKGVFIQARQSGHFTEEHIGGNGTREEAQVAVQEFLAKLSRKTLVKFEG